MKSFEEYVAENLEVEMPHGNIPGSWFVENGIPMVVRCTCCEMTMASPSAWVNDEGYTFCADCAGVNEE